MATWIPPQLVFPASGENSSLYPRFGSGGSGAPEVHIDPESFTTADGAVTDTVVGSFLVQPSDAVVTIVNDPSGVFKIVANVLKITGTPPASASSPYTVIVRGTWAGKTTDKTIEVDVTPFEVVSVNLSGSGTISSAAAHGTAVGTLSVSPSAGSRTVTYALDPDTLGSWQIVGSSLQVGATPNTAAVYVVWVVPSINGVAQPAAKSRMNVTVT